MDLKEASLKFDGPAVESAEPLAGEIPAPSRWQEAFRSLRHPNFRLFFAGQLISLIGTWMQQVAQAWLVYRLTGSSLLLGTVTFAGQIPVFLLAPLGGIVADRCSRRNALVLTQSVMMVLALVLAVLTLAHIVQPWHIIVLAALLGIANAFDIPIRQSFLGDMVSRADLVNAIALNSSMFNGARVIGPAVAGIVVALIGEGWCFFVNGISFVAVIAGLLLMRLAPPRHSIEGSPLQNVIEGFWFIFRNGPVRDLLLLVGLVSFTAMPYSVLMPVFADQVLHGGAKTLGALMGASGAGALVGALLLAMKTTLRGLGHWVAACCTGFGVFLILFAYSHSLHLSVALLAPIGFFIMVQMASSNTLIQSMVPDRLRGRIMAAYSMMLMGMAPFGALLAGSLAHRAGAPLTVAIGGVTAICGGLLFFGRLSTFRQAARELIMAQRMAAGATEETPAQSLSK